MTTNMERKLDWWAQALAAVAIVLCALLFWNQSSQTSAWTYPYFSGAVNLGTDLAWRIDATAYTDFAKLTYAEQMEFKFVPSAPENLIPYSILDRGYVFVVWIAQTLIFWLPQIKAVLWFQVLFHVFSVVWVLRLLPTKRQQLIFFVGYGVNPVVLHFVTFAYLYYWQVVPSLLWIVYESRNGDSLNQKVYWMVAAMMAAFLIRQSTILVSLLALGYIVRRERTVHAWISLLLVVGFVVFAKNPSQPWHTAYVGLGAYPNAAGIELSDEAGYSKFKELSGTVINTIPPDGNYYNDTVRTEYYVALRKELVGYVIVHPQEVVRNALVNSAQSFSLGYVVNHRNISYLSAGVGLLVLLIMAWQGMYFCMALLYAGVAGFVLYFPPIPAYMFGNYLLLVWMLAQPLDRLTVTGLQSLCNWFRSIRERGRQ